MPGGMRVAVVSDIHGNLTALEAVVADLRRRAPNRVVHDGDLALMGPRPAEVVDRVRELGWPGVVGNTDELVWRPGEHQHQLERAPALAALLALLFDAYAPDTRERLGDAPEGRSEYPSPGGRGAQDGVPTHMVHHRRDRC